MEPITFSISGAPVAKGRPRATVRGGFASIYTDSKTRKYESDVGKLAKVAMRGRAPLSGPLSVSIRFRLGIPISTSKRARASFLAGESAYLGTKDLDNLAKAILDSLNKIVWIDDVQIVRLFVTKAASASPGVDIRVESLSGD
jgi:Holliday junction resolvase RusA-like endonuclease